MYLHLFLEWWIYLHHNKSCEIPKNTMALKTWIKNSENQKVFNQFCHNKQQVQQFFLLIPCLSLIHFIFVEFIKAYLAPDCSYLCVSVNISTALCVSFEFYLFDLPLILLKYLLSFENLISFLHSVCMCVHHIFVYIRFQCNW